MENSALAIEFSVSGEEKRKNCYLEEKIVVMQDEDITKIKYNLYLKGEYIVKVFSIKNEKETLLKTEEYKATGGRTYKYFLCELNFEDKIDGIKISFIDGLADDLFIPIVFVDADKEKYYAKKEKERKDNLLKTADIKVSTGSDLVNIYFQPCCEDYARAEVALYKDNMMLAKYKVDEEVFFKSINGLAYGKYEFVLKQFNTRNETILETEKISFQIVPPTFGMGRHTVVNRI